LLWVTANPMHTLDKPSGIPVFPPHADPNGDCVLSRWLAQSQPSSIDWPEGFAGGIAHRLDISTSGALLAADTVDELAEIRRNFASKRYLKRYRFLAAKEVPWDENVVSFPISHHKRKRKRMVVRRGANTPHRGKWLDAETSFQRIHGNLWQVEMRTGVMHQIRVHAAFVGLALLGDKLYGGGDGERFFLHHVGIDGVTDTVPTPEWSQL
jgi:23S rRNA-/tRNA-specific pseudouridylate synthase